MNRRKFLSLFPAVVAGAALPGNTAAACLDFARSAEAKQEVRKKEILSATYTYGASCDVLVVYSDQTCEFVPLDTLSEKWRK